MPKLESDFVFVLKRELRQRFHDCFIIKQDSGQVQGIPDLLILWESQWAMLETKRSRRAAEQPNQEYYVEKFDEMSFAAFVDPLNYQEVLDDMERAFGV